MKTEKNILIAFLLNLSFAIFEFFGGFFTNSVAILSDSIHDLGDALSIGISFFLEKKSKKKADEHYTCGYVRYSVLGGVITTTILLVGSILVILSSIRRIFYPEVINYSGMIVFAVIGVILNFIAAYVTKELLTIKGLEDVHHIHIWSMDGVHNYATMHLVTKDKNAVQIKKKIRELLLKYDIVHTILETEEEACDDIDCDISFEEMHEHHHHHH